jgi:hypothetical protein
MSCTERLDAAILADYWNGLLSEEEGARVEEHVFACEECSGRLAEVQAMAEGVRALTGSLMTVVSERLLDQAVRHGLHVRRYDPPAGGSVECTVAAEDDFLVGGLAADLSSANRLDLSLCDPAGNEQTRLVDIPFDPGASGVIWQMSITFAKAAPTSAMVARLIDVREAGEETLLGEYRFNHTRTLPGPGAW